MALVLWLLWWMLLAASPFNHYWDGDSSTLVFDCDRDTELAAALAMIMIWLTTFVIVGVSVWLKFWRQFQMRWGINALSLFLSLASLVRFYELLVYSQELPQSCP